MVGVGNKLEDPLHVGKDEEEGWRKELHPDWRSKKKKKNSRLREY